MELTNQPDGATHEVHGCRFIRSGTCNLCGGCDNKCSICPHGKLNNKKQWECTIYNDRFKVCVECTNNPESLWYKKGKDITHTVCVRFPDHPWLEVIKNNKCSYIFKELKENNISKKEELDKIWQLL